MSEKSRAALDRETEILAVAASHLNTMGVSVEWFTEIAASLSLTRPALYKYVSNREDLQFRCYERTCATLDERLSIAASASSDPAEVLSLFLTDRQPRQELAVISELEALPPELRQPILARQSDLAGRIAAIVEVGVKEGLFRALDCALVAQIVLGMASWPSLYRRWGEGVDAALVDQGSCELLFRGLAGDRAAGLRPPPRLVDLTPPRPDVFNKTDLEDAKREGVLVAASRLFNSRGIGATRVEDVGAAVGLSKRAIYHHVGHKQELVDACVERAYGYYLAVMEAAHRFEGDRLEALFACVRDVVWATGDDSVTVLSPYVGFGQLSPSERRAVARHVQRMSAGYRAMLEQGMAEGSIRPAPVDAILASLPGVFSWAANGQDPDPAGRARLADDLAALVVQGILAPK